MTKNEWDPLKKVIVGIADNAKVPRIDSSVRSVNFSNLDCIDTIQIGPYPSQVIEEANEDLDLFCEFLTQENIEVVRPLDNNPAYFNYCPRDTSITFDNLCIAAPMPIKARKNEWEAYRHHIDCEVVNLNTNHSDNLYNSNSIKNPSILAINETQPAFDAANVIKANDDLLYLVSNSGNKKGAELLQEVVGDRATVRLLEDVYSYMHIDSTVSFLKEGLALVNPARISDKNQLPYPFNKWDIIFAPEPVDIGFYPGYCNSSKWINVNLLSIRPDLVVLEERQTNLAKILEKYNIESALLPMRHARSLAGCFHCVTLDLERDHS